MTVRPHTEQAKLPRSKVTLWILDTYGEVDAQGNPLPRKRVRFHGREKAALVEHKRWVASLQTSIQGPEPEPPPKPTKARKPRAPQGPTLKAYVRETYLPYVRSKGVESTTRTKTRHFENHVLPILGDLSIHEANTREAVQRLKAYLTTNPKIRKNSFRDLVLLTFSHCLTHAADHDDGPGLLTNRIKVKLFGEDRKAQGVPIGGYRAGHLRHLRFSEGEMKALLKAASEMPDAAWWTVFVLLGSSAGCRVGEAAARKWEHVDWQHRQLTINSIICSETDEEYIDRTKNNVLADNPLTNQLFEALEKLPRTSPYILGAGKDRPYLTSTNMGDRFAILTRKAFGKETRHYHRLRHTCASTLADRNVNPEVIRQLMRHKSLKTTYGYIQPSRASLQDAVSSLNF